MKEKIIYRSGDMKKAIMTLIGLLGLSAGVKMYQVLKILQIDVDNMNKKEIEKLVKDKELTDKIND